MGHFVKHNPEQMNGGRTDTLNTKSRHDTFFVVTGGTGGCRYDNQWTVTKELESWQLSIFKMFN